MEQSALLPSLLPRLPQSGYPRLWDTPGYSTLLPAVMAPSTDSSLLCFVPPLSHRRKHLAGMPSSVTMEYKSKNVCRTVNCQPHVPGCKATGTRACLFTTWMPTGRLGELSIHCGYEQGSGCSPYTMGCRPRCPFMALTQFPKRRFCLKPHWETACFGQPAPSRGNQILSLTCPAIQIKNCKNSHLK